MYSFPSAKIRTMLILLCMLAIGGCSSGSSGDNNAEDSSNWDSLTWDTDDWS